MSCGISGSKQFFLTIFICRCIAMIILRYGYITASWPILVYRWHLIYDNRFRKGYSKLLNTTSWQSPPIPYSYPIVWIGIASLPHARPKRVIFLCSSILLTWIIHYKVLGGITYTFPNFNGENVLFVLERWSSVLVSSQYAEILHSSSLLFAFA